MPSTNFVPGTVVTSDWLNDVDAHVFYGRQWTSHQMVNVKDPQYGGVGDGVTDDTLAMAAAHATGKTVFYPAGTYKFTKLSTTITSGGIVGEGQTQTILFSTDTSTDDLFTFVGNSPGGIGNGLTFRDFQIQGTKSGDNPAKADGAGIAIAPTSGENSYASFLNVTTTYMPIGFDFVAASLWRVVSCNFLSYTIAGIQVANTNVADSGDSSITSCVFNNPYTTGSGIYQKSSGGLKVVSNKFLGGLRGYTMALEDSTSVLVIAANSFENMTGADIALSRAVAGKAFVNVCITGNEFSVGGVAIATDANAFLSEVNISSNQINMGAVGSNACIALNNVTDFFIGSNIIKGNGGLGSSAINITSCTNGKIGPNTYANLPNPISVSSSPTVSVDYDTQYGTSPASSTSGYTSYGTLYLGPSVSVTFPIAFLDAPSPEAITLTSALGNGCLGGIVTSTSTTGFTFQPISSITGVAAQCYWSAEGII